MSGRKELFVIALLVLAVAGLSLLPATRAFTSSSAQPAQNDQTLQTLLSEVHQLRLVLQRAHISTYNAQITVERMKLQQQRVDRLTGYLDQVRGQLAGTRKILSQTISHMKSTEFLATSETDPAKRADVERSLKSWKAEIEELTEKEQQEERNETQLNAQLQIEQAKLAELNERLDKLQRELETQMSTDTPQPSGKRL